MNKLLPCIFFLLCFISAKATHNRSGEITYKYLGGLSYEVTITTYTDACVGCADRCEMPIDWGDGTSGTAPRVNGYQQNGSCPNRNMGEITDNPEIRKNIYKATHNYPSSGTYFLSTEDPNRNAGVSNIQNSVDVPFYIQSELYISPSLGSNNSPVLTNPPIDDGCVGQRFEHNAGAYDIDGDSLAYRLVPCRTTGGQLLPNIYNVQDSISINPVTGDLIWDVPRNVGVFNFAFQIVEYRKNARGNFVEVGYVTRDIQIDINGNCNNEPPIIDPIGPFCIEAGQSLNFIVSANDPDNQQVTLSAFGGPFADELPPSKAIFNTSSGTPSVAAAFTWQTNCEHVRLRSYQVTFKAEDVPPPNTNGSPLVDLYTTEITVIAPSPKNPVAEPSQDAINLHWNPNVCTDAIGYRIYRRRGSYGFVPGPCETGVPEYTGYTFLDSTTALNDTAYTDTFDIDRGIEYCYMVYAIFEDGSESYASVEFCASLPITLPLMTKVDVITTDAATGQINVAWTPPQVIDSTLNPPPYGYDLYRAEGTEGAQNFTLLQQFNDLYDTTYSDLNLNTQDNGYTYYVDFFSDPNRDKVGQSDPASSIYLVVEGSDMSNILHMGTPVPWENYRYVIFRETPTGSGVFDSIAQSFDSTYVDTGLINGDNYCYKVLAYGRYTANDSLPKPLLNNSQIACGIPIDTAAPCPPVLTADFTCALDELTLNFQNGTGENCADDIAFYDVYYKRYPEDEFTTPMITGITELSITIPKDGTLIGCYAITATDDAGNDPGGTSNTSLLSNVVCVDACPDIEFPNVFTPNGDDVNDFFVPTSQDDIETFNIQIFNRWGTLVFESNSPEAFFSNGWDGTDVTTGQNCAEGVYYYVCTYTPLSLAKTAPLNVKGFVHLMR